MFTWFRGHRELKRTAHDLYGSIVALSRQPRLFDEIGIPDSVEGRFEALAAHMFLFLERLRREGEAGAPIAQALVDGFFRDLEISSRELGVGDLAVPKKMRRLAVVYAERLEEYREAINAADPAMLEKKIAQNMRLADAGPAAALFADYLRRMHDRLQSVEMKNLHLLDVNRPLQ